MPADIMAEARIRALQHGSVSCLSSESAREGGCSHVFGFAPCCAIARLASERRLLLRLRKLGGALPITQCARTGPSFGHVIRRNLCICHKHLRPAFRSRAAADRRITVGTGHFNFVIGHWFLTTFRHTHGRGGLRPNDGRETSAGTAGRRPPRQRRPRAAQVRHAAHQSGRKREPPLPGIPVNVSLKRSIKIFLRR